MGFDDIELKLAKADIEIFFCIKPNGQLRFSEEIIAYISIKQASFVIKSKNWVIFIWLNSRNGPNCYSTIKEF